MFIHILCGKKKEFVSFYKQQQLFLKGSSTGYAAEQFRLWRASRTAVALRGRGGANLLTRWLKYTWRVFFLILCSEIC